MTKKDELCDLFSQPQVSRRGVNICLEKMECMAKSAANARQLRMVVHYSNGEQYLFCFVSTPEPLIPLSSQICNALPSVATPSEVNIKFFLYL